MVDSVWTINTSEITYAATYDFGSSPTLSCLGPPPEGASPSARAADLIDSPLGGTGNTSEKYGYRFVYSPGPREEKGRINSYSITASPIKPGAASAKFLCTDQTRVMRVNATGPAGPTDAPLVR